MAREAKNKHGLSDKWEETGKNPLWELENAKVGDKFFGVFLDREEDVGPNNSMLYNFVRYADQDFVQRIGTFSIWGTTLLDTRFKNFTRGEQVAIVYLGKQASEQRKGSSYHNFEVYHTPPEKAVKLGGEEPSDPSEIFDGEAPEYTG